MSLTQKLALTWLTTFDKSQFMYKILKSIHIIFRFSFYILMSLALVFFLYKISSIINIREYSDIPLFLQNLLIVIGYFIKYCSIIFIMGIFSYESIYSFDVDKYLADYKSKQDFIKNNKMERWRISNMHLVLRIICYLGVYFFIYLLFEHILISSFLDYYDNQPSKEVYLHFLYDFNFFMISYTIIFIVLIIVFDYFVRKKIKTKNQKFPQETNIGA
jgi:hypothetical protein